MLCLRLDSARILRSIALLICFLFMVSYLLLNFAHQVQVIHVHADLNTKYMKQT